MFFRIITAIFFSLITSSVFANGWCDSRPSKAERDRCYAANREPARDWNSLSRQAVDLMNRNINSVKSSTSIPAKEKEEFLQGVYKSQKNIDNGCTDNKCVTLSVAQLNNRIAAFYRKYHPQ